MKRRCPSCGVVVGPTASFCRACGTPYQAATPVAPAATAERAAPTRDQAAQEPRRGPVAIGAAVAILVVGAGVAAAILLGAGGGSSTTTVVKTAADRGRPAPAPGTPEGGAIEAARYAQAGSFQTLEHAEAERLRLAAQGIDVKVVSSDLAEELYPGFRVLLGGPIHSHAEAAELLSQLHRNGVPSAFVRELTPAGDAEPAAAAGDWSGSIERTSSEHPRLDGTLAISLSLAEDGASGSLELPGLGCHAGLSLNSSARNVFDYAQAPPCAGAGTVRLRLSGDELLATLPSPQTDSFSLGTLNRG
jgi:hypothetical protein